MSLRSRIAAITLGLFASSPALSQSQGWLLVEKTIAKESYIKKDSVELGTIDGDDACFVAHAEVMNNVKLQGRVGIKLKECKQGYGRLYFYSSTNTLLYNIDFILGGQSTASKIAGPLCNLARLSLPR